MDIFDPKYNDLRNGTYVNPLSDDDDISAVSNPDGNPARDESHRDMTDESFRPSFSNLKNTYMISANGHNARERFWGKQYSADFSYRNSNADIDDPIFTGFTLSIDKLNSPLFYTIGQYDSVASGRTHNDGTASTRNLADEIENCIRNNYSSLIRGAVNSYDIASLITKEKYPGSDAEIGYGMQHNVYVDGLPYGATEYIYMVDKMIKDMGSPQDVGGHFSLGDGSVTVSTSDITDQEQLEEDYSELTKRIDTAENFLNNTTNINNHQAILDNKETAENDLKATQQQIEEANNVIKALEAQKNNISTIDFETAIKLKLQDLLQQIDNKVIDLKPTGNRSEHSLAEYNNICQDITNLDNQLSSMIALYHGNPANVQALIDSLDESAVKVDSCIITVTPVSSWSDYTNLPIENDNTHTFDGSEAYKKGAKYKSISIKVKTTINTSAVESQLAEAKKNLEQLETQEKGQKTLLDTAISMVNNDPYEQTRREYEDAQRDREDIGKTIDLMKEAVEIGGNGSQGVSADAVLNSGNVSQGINDDFTTQNANKPTLPKAPQTVYDMLGFIRGMTRLTEEYPYLLQTITGLDNAYKNNYVVKDSFRGSGEENVISINIYESLDMKVSGMFNKYFNAAYDAQYRRERLPVNLRRFNCSIFVHDIRNFLGMATKVGQILRKKSSLSVPKIVEVALNTMSAVEFKFYGCEIIPEETGNIFDNVTNADRGDMRMTNFTFSYSDCVINYLPFEDLKNHLLGSLERGAHKPSVSVGGNTSVRPEKLRYTKGGKVYNMKASDFDKNKPHLNGLDNVYEYETKIGNNGGNEIEFTGELEGLGGHDTAPQQNSPIPENFTDKSGYTLNSPLGNVNKNDKQIGGSSAGVSADQLRGIFASNDDKGFIADIGNVNDNDRFEGIPEISIHDVDKSVLGNVNDDDYDEYLNLQNNRDEGVKVKDAFSQAAATFESINSANENLMQSRAEFDRLFNHLATSVSASVGLSRENVYFGYLDQIRNIVYPGLPTPVIGSINYNSIDDNANTTVDVNTPQLTGINATIQNGLVSDIGNVNDNDNMEDLPTGNGNSFNVTGTYTQTTNGIITNLGDVIYDGVENPILTNIGDVIPDEVPNPILTNLENVYPPETTLPTLTQIGDVLPDDVQTPIITNIENVYPPETVPPTQGYIDDVLPDDVPTPIVTNIENVYPTLTTPPIQGDLGDVLPDDPLLPNIEDIGNVYPNLDDPETQGYIGDVLPDDPNLPPVENIGNVYPTLTTPPIQGDLGDVLPDDILGDNISEIGNVYPKLDKPDNVDKLGNIYPKTKDLPSVKNLGDVLPDDVTGNTTEVIGNIYPAEENGETVSNLGDVLPDDEAKSKVTNIDNVYPKEIEGGRIDNLGKLDMSADNNPDVTAIGNIYPDIETPETNKYLGDVMPEDKKKDNVEKLGNIYPKIKPTGKVTEIDNIYPRPVETEKVISLGDVIADEELNETVKTIENIYPGQDTFKTTKFLGDVIDDDKQGKIIEELENIYPEQKEKETQGYIDNVYPETGEHEIVEYIDDVIKEPESGKPLEKIGNVYPEEGEMKVVKKLGDVIPDENTRPAKRRIGNVYPDHTTKPSKKYIDNVYPEPKRKDTSRYIDNVYPNVTKKETQRYISDVMEDEELGDPTKMIGNVYHNTDGDNNTIKNLGKVNLEDKTKDILMKLDKLVEKKENEKMVEDLGDVEEQKPKIDKHR